jgi:hypothetical protein
MPVGGNNCNKFEQVTGAPNSLQSLPVGGNNCDKFEQVAGAPCRRSPARGTIAAMAAAATGDYPERVLTHDVSSELGGSMFSGGTVTHTFRVTPVLIARPAEGSVTETIRCAECGEPFTCTLRSAAITRRRRLLWLGLLAVSLVALVRSSMAVLSTVADNDAPLVELLLTVVALFATVGFAVAAVREDGLRGRPGGPGVGKDQLTYRKVISLRPFRILRPYESRNPHRLVRLGPQDTLP